MTDFYAGLGLGLGLGLDPAAPSPRLAARLTAEIDAMPPGPARVHREQARAILGDESKRATYDARLRDPSAPSWTPEELHQLALAGSVPRGRVATIVGAGAQRIMVLVAAGLAALLVLVIGLASCGSDNGSSPSSMPAAGGPSSADTDTGGSCEVSTNANLDKVRWRESQSDAPARVIKLTQKIDVSPEHPWGDVVSNVNYARLGEGFHAHFRGLTQLQDKSIAVLQGPKGAFPIVVTLVSPNGDVLSGTEYNQSTVGQLPDGFDLSRDPVGQGYFHITGGDDVPIPPEAAGTKEGQNFAQIMLPDAFDESTAWLVLRGSDTAIYKGTVYRDSGGAC